MDAYMQLVSQGPINLVLATPISGMQYCASPCRNTLQEPSTSGHSMDEEAGMLEDDGDETQEVDEEEDSDLEESTSSDESEVESYVGSKNMESINTVMTAASHCTV